MYKGSEVNTLLKDVLGYSKGNTEARHWVNIGSTDTTRADVKETKDLGRRVKIKYETL